jgi:hypothetical protein
MAEPAAKKLRSHPKQDDADNDARNVGDHLTFLLPPSERRQESINPEIGLREGHPLDGSGVNIGMRRVDWLILMLAIASFIGAVVWL